MKPRIVEREGFLIVGVEDDAGRLGKEDPGFEGIWFQRFIPKASEIGPYSTDGANYGVFLDTKGSDLKGGRYVAGMSVKPDTPVPDGWVLHEIPQAQYAVFDTTLQFIGETADEAFDKWFPGSEFEQDLTKPRFDYHPPGTTGQDSPVSVWIPVRRKQ